MEGDRGENWDNCNSTNNKIFKLKKNYFDIHLQIKNYININNNYSDICRSEGCLEASNDLARVIHVIWNHLFLYPPESIHLVKAPRGLEAAVYLPSPFSFLFYDM